MKISISLIIFCLFTGMLSLQAQQGQGGGQRRTVEERVKATMAKITPELKLESNQLANTDSAFAGFYRTMDKMREAMQQGTRPDRDQMTKVMTDRDEKLKKVFTEDQFKKFKESEPTMRQGGGRRPPQGGTR